ncbi:quinone-dependent dihydroorotate dehydrogenase [Synechocystis sp. LKSZ1]|uniref:quinone-dependent dihydroorotate dehydrogenase n=1 Tax=Synechocystis sp. LKSZ1 TaxID=3144951 RepID=UPI00336BF103
MFSSARPLYPWILRITRHQPEAGHRLLLQILQGLDHFNRGGGGWLLEQVEQSFSYRDPRLSQSLWGLTFPNILGLAAGCDKDGEAAALWPALGFGFAELGAVTQHPQPGNPTPRLFRLPADQAVLNRLGANNGGAVALAQRLADTWQYYPRSIPIGINLCKSKITPLEQAADDYQASFLALQNVADYFVVNVSSPNTPGLRSLQTTEELAKILAALQSVNTQPKPLLVKISPDLDWPDLDSIINLAQRYHLSGLVATNTTIGRTGLKTQILPETQRSLQQEAGGISGQPLRQRSTEVIRYLYQKTQGQLPIIGIGGIFSAEDAWEKIQAGASLLQFYTGWIYQGPWCVKDILAGLSRKLDQQGLKQIQAVIGQKT